jgi:hypothetical protein
LISLDPASPQATETERPRSIVFVALLIAAFAALAAIYGICVATAVLPFNAGAWVVGEDVASRGWLAYILSAIIHSAAALGLWRQWKWARWLAIFLLSIGLLPAVPGISAAVVDLRIPGIALWGTLIILRTASLYMLFNAD